MIANMLPVLYERVESYGDRDLTFFVQVHHDAERLAWMLQRLRGLYPESRVVVCSDGDDDPRLPTIAERANAEFYLGENLYALGHGGKVCHRMLELFFQQPSRWLFKVDPDTCFHRRFAYLPAHPGVFGTLQCNPTLCSIQGGCCGFSREASERMFRSEAFLCPSLLDAERTWARHPPLWRYMEKVQRVSKDWMCGYVATALGVAQFGFDEVLSRWKKPVSNPGLRYAVTHPCRPTPPRASGGR
jgi:hypothetical protein